MILCFKLEEQLAIATYKHAYQLTADYNNIFSQTDDFIDNLHLDSFTSLYLKGRM